MIPRLKVLAALVTFLPMVSVACGEKTPSAPTTPLAAANTALQVVSFSAEPAVAVPGQMVKLSWAVQNAKRVAIEGVGFVGNETGAVTVSPTSSTTFKLTAVAANGFTVQRSVDVAVVAVVFEVDRACLQRAGTASLQWSVTGATRVTIDNGVGDVAPAGSYTVHGPYDWWGEKGEYWRDRTYTLSASTPQGTLTRQVQVHSTVWDDFTYCVSGVPKAAVIAMQRFGTSHIIHDSFYDATLPWIMTGRDIVPQYDALGPHYLSATHNLASGCIRVQMFQYGSLSKEAQACGPNATAVISDYP